jgi:hypothetical protein
MEAENGREFDPAPSKQVPQAFAFSFWFLNVNPSVASVISVANKFLIFLSFILKLLFGVKSLCGLGDLCGKLVFPWIT